MSEPSESNAAGDGSSTRSNFVAEIVREHLAEGRYAGVVTRFPPEPNGYLHIGHAKSICLNFGLANEFGGRCHLRFDDTNPTKEDVEYVDSIRGDVRWLGFDWGENQFYASDYFERLYEVAVGLMRAGKAYVCSLTDEEIRAYRGTVTEAGRPSPGRDRSIEENLDLFARMRAGEFADGAHVVRARIDMAAANMKMRDPLLYRIRHAHHYRTGDDWCIYPMYDFAHCLSDAFEGISHSICTLEFENNRELYDWILEEAGFTEPRPHQYEFARLNLTYTVMSKRKLLALVQSGEVSGWDDPRMPTIAGLRRRGITAEAIRAFADLIGVAKANSTVDLDKLEFCIRDDLNARAPRAMAVVDPLRLVITNYESSDPELLTVPNWPHDVPKDGDREVPFGRALFIERDDFAVDPPKGFKRLTPGGVVRLRYAYVVRCDEVLRDKSGEVSELRCTYFPDADEAPTAKGIIHWVSATHGVPAEIRLYDRLFSVERPDADPRDYRELINPDSLRIMPNAVVEPAVATSAPGSRFQFERIGYFYAEPEGAPAGRRVFNRIVGLKDTWAKAQDSVVNVDQVATAQETPARGPVGAPAAAKEPKTSSGDRARSEDPTLAERFAAWPKRFDLDPAIVDSLTRDRATSDFFLATALSGAASPNSVAAWLLNDVLPAVRDRSLAESALEPAAIGDLVARVDRGEITAAIGRDVLAVLVAEGGNPADIIERHNWRPVEDDDALRALVQQVLAAHPAEAQRLADGETKLVGLFVGQIMKRSKGKANAKKVTDLLISTTRN